MIRNNLIIVFAIATLLLAGCGSQEKSDFREAQKAIEKGHFRIALTYLDQITKRNTGSPIDIQATREAARITFYELKDFQKAVDYNKLLVLHSKDPQERILAQKQVATIYFDNLQNYSLAIVEFNKLLVMPHNDLEETQYRLSIARAYFYLANYFQSLSEIENLLQRKSDENVKFGALTLKANILLAQKHYAKAAETFKILISTNSERAQKENIGLALAACYEESSDFANAIKVLEEYKKNYNPREYIELRIKRLQERLKNAPGAKGFRK